MHVQFNVLLRCRAFEKKHQGETAENNTAEHPELIHVREQHRLALHGAVEVRYGKLTKVAITWSQFS